MKGNTFFMIICTCLFTTNTIAQIPDTLVEIRDQSGNVRMRVHKNGAFMLGGSYDGGTASGGIPVQGGGTRMTWYPEKAAFRVGNVSSSEWDDAFTGYFSMAAGDGVRASGDNSIALGLRCNASGVSSIAVGEQNTASGAASVALGYHSHTNARQGSFVFADRSTVDTLRAGLNHSANWRVSGGFRIFTASNLSTGVTVQSGVSISNWGQSNAVISTSTGAYLSTAGVWQSVSDVNRKHLFEHISGEDILGRLKGLEISRWSYRTEHDSVRHIGPTAQDFYAAFDLGNDEHTIGAVDADGIALAAVKALETRTRNLSAQLLQANANNIALQKRLEALEQKPGSNLAATGLPLLAVMVTALLFGLAKRNKKAIAEKV